MIKLNSDEIFDLNTIGLFFALFVAVFMAVLLLLYTSQWIVIMGLELLSVASIYFLLKRIYHNKNTAILINNEAHWFVLNNDQTLEVELKDYWLWKKHIFLWVYSKQSSVSFVVDRSIIGEHRFSQLRAIMGH